MQVWANETETGDSRETRPDAGGLWRAHVDARGEGKNRSYQFTPTRRLGQEAAYVRQRGFEQVQAEQMVGQYVKAYGKITRKQAAELCKITSTQARDLLGRLVKKGSWKCMAVRKEPIMPKRSKIWMNPNRILMHSKKGPI